MKVGDLVMLKCDAEEQHPIGVVLEIASERHTKVGWIGGVGYAYTVDLEVIDGDR